MEIKAICDCGTAMVEVYDGMPNFWYSQAMWCPNCGTLYIIPDSGAPIARRPAMIMAENRETAVNFAR